MPTDEKKEIGLKTYDKVSPNNRIKYLREAEEAQNKSKKKKRFNLRPHIECSVIEPHPPILLDRHPCI
jgi:hypothetical protein